MSRAEKLAHEKGCGVSAIAIAWLLRRGACPIVGLNSVQRIEESLEALEVELTDDQTKFLEEPYQPLAV